MGETYCMSCREWFDRKEPACPDCGWERPAFNKWLRTATLDRHLWDQAARADRERNLEHQLRG